MSIENWLKEFNQSRQIFRELDQYTRLNREIQAAGRTLQEEKQINQLKRAISAVSPDHMSAMRAPDGRLEDLLGDSGIANNHLIQLAKDAFEKSIVHSSSLKNTHPSWLEGFGSISETMDQLGLATGSKVLESFKYSAANEHIWRRLNEFDQGNFKDTALNSIWEEYSSLRNQFEKLIVPVKASSDILRWPEHLLNGSSSELFLTGRTIETLVDEPEYTEEYFDETFPEIGVNVEDCPRLLSNLNPVFVKLYFGAEESIESNNPDKTRHALSSMRELIYNILWTLAPNDEVLMWSQNPKHFYLKHGQKRPTRKGRIEYIFRAIDYDDGLSDFVESDTEGIIKLIDYLNKVHDPYIELSKIRLQSMFLKFQCYLVFMLKSNELN